MFKKGITWLMVLGSLSLWGQSTGDWPSWRGANHDGVVIGADFNLGKIIPGLTPLWEAPVGKGYSSPSISGNKLFILGNDQGKDVVRALNPLTGAELWKYSYDCRPGEYPGTRASPTVEGNFVYTMSRDGQLFCFDAEKGSIKWSRNLQQDAGAKPPTWGIAGSVILEGSLLLLNVGSSGMALDKVTGKTIWASPSGTCGYSSPVVYTYKGTKYMALFGERDLYSVAVATGTVAWKIRWQTDYDVNASDPLIFDNKVFFSTGYNKGSALYDFSSGTPVLVWQNKNMVSHFPSFFYKNGFIYGIHGETFKSYVGEMRCLNAKTGDVVWGQRVGFGSMIMVNDLLVAVNDTGKLTVADVNPEKYSERATAKVSKSLVWSPPVLAHGLLYIRNDKGTLVCLDVRS